MLKELYDYQKEVILLTDNSNLGQIILPTGTGKSFIEAAILQKAIEKDKSFNIYLVNVPEFF